MRYVKGTVIDALTGVPIKGVRVFVTDTKFGSTHNNNNNNTGSDFTDSNGNYEIKYYKKSHINIL